jgi:hypothetical protein
MREDGLKYLLFLFLIIFISGCTSPAQNDLIQPVQQVQPVVEQVQPTSSIQLCSDVSEGQTVACRIPRVYCYYKPGVAGQPTYCDNAPYPTETFVLVAWGQNWSNLNGRCLVVTGVVSRYGSDLQIEASSLSQVKDCP